MNINNIVLHDQLFAVKFNKIFGLMFKQITIFSKPTKDSYSRGIKI